MSRRPGFDERLRSAADSEPASVASRAPPARLGGFTRRRRPAAGLRPTVVFAIAFASTVGWVAFGVWVSSPWREDLERAIGPVMAWVIPVVLAYIPGLVIGLMIATLLLSPYRELAQGTSEGAMAGRRVASGDHIDRCLE